MENFIFRAVFTVIDNCKLLKIFQQANSIKPIKLFTVKN